MRYLFLALVVLILSVLVALAAQEDPGYMLISRGDWALETSLVFGAAVAAISFVLLYLLVRSFIRTWGMPARLRAWRQERRLRRARNYSQRGLMELAEGRWAKAERHLSRYADDSDLPLLNYLGAARAAQKLDADRRRDHYLAMAHESMPEAELAVGLTQAEVQLSHGQLEQALATLRHLQTVAPRHSHVLYLLKRLYIQLGSWGDLALLIPELRRNRVMPPEELDHLERDTHLHLLRIAAEAGNAARLKGSWERTPKSLRADPELVEMYARKMALLGEPAAADTALRDALKKNWDPELVKLYGTIVLPDGARQLAAAESWLRQHERDAILLLTLGRLSLRNQLFGKARGYLEASIGAAPTPEAYLELGRLLADHLNEREKADECFRLGLERALGEPKRKVLIPPPPAAALSPVIE